MYATRLCRSARFMGYFLWLLIMFAACCAQEPKTHSPDNPNSPPDRGNKPIVQVSEAYLSTSFPQDDIDSVAVWHGPAQHWIIATAKATHRLLVFDASTGVFLKAVGGKGSGLGEYQRPNGIAVMDSNLIVVERDNHRLQVLDLPDLSPLGWIGGEDLVRPYGLAALPDNGIFVTDNYNAPETPADLSPFLADLLNRRIKHFVFSIDDGKGIESKLQAQFGDTNGPGILWRVETIAADEHNNRLLIADEIEKVFKVYSLDGHFTGEIMGKGIFRFEPEGAALVRFGNNGYWIACDQDKNRSFFRVFDRTSLGYLGTFVGKTTANTDGVALTQTSFPSFPHGAFFAVHNDSAVSAFDLGEILGSLGLACNFRN